MSVIQPDGSSENVNVHLPLHLRIGLPWIAGVIAVTGLLYGVTNAGLAPQDITQTSPTASPSFYSNLVGLELLDQDGRAFQPNELLGKIVLVNFVFTGCATTCSTQTRELAALQQALPETLLRDVRFVSISVDPLGDTPAVLRAYGQSAGADFSSWTFATGRPQDMERLSEPLRLFRSGTSPAQPQDHATALWLVDARGRLMQRYDGASVDTARLADEFMRLRALTTAASS